MPSLFPFRPRIQDSEWIGGRYTFPVKVREGDTLIQPEIVIWLELPSGVVVGSSIVDPRQPVLFGETLAEAMRRPAAGSPRRPARIRVPNAVLADALRGTVGNIPVVVGPVPELDEVFAQLRQEIPNPEPSYLAEGAIAPAVVAELFSAAGLLFRAAPWRHQSDQQVLRVDIPALGVDGACLSVIGAAGESFGALLFRSIDDFHSFVDASERFGTSAKSAPRTSGEPALLSLSFDRKKQLPPSMAREIELHRWPVAGAKAYPAVLAIDTGMNPLPLTERHYRIITATTRALVTFIARHPSLFEGPDPQPVSDSITGDDKVTVTVTAPYGEGTDFPMAAFLAPSEASPVSSPVARPPGRNNPCHCGSGRKYKNCHLDSDRARSTAPPATETIHQRDFRLVRDIARFASSRFGRDWLGRSAGGAVGGDEAYLQLFLPLTAWTAIAGGKRIADSFLEQNEARLSPEEREWFAAQQRAWLSVWEVSRVQPGLIDVRDLLTGEVRSVREEMGSRVLVARDTFLARMIDFRGISLFGGMYGRVLSPSISSAVIADVRAKLRARKGDVGIEHLQDSVMGRFLIDRWRDAVAEADRRASTPPKLQNTDGDPLLLVTESFRFEADARAEIEKRLAAMDEVDSVELDPEQSEFVFARPGNKVHKSWENTIVGRVMLAEETLDIETNSENRAAALGRRVRDACAGLLRDLKRKVTKPATKGAGAKNNSTQRAEMTPEELSMVRVLKESHYRGWIDTPIPALGGKTPRAAARAAKSRAQVDLLLRDMENLENRGPEAARFDVRNLRRELGLDG
jgi:hypothetical protein